MSEANSTAVIPDADSLVPVAIESLYCDDGFEFDLYLCLGRNQPPVLYRERSFPCRHSDLDLLRSRGIRLLYIPADSHQQYLEYLQTKLLADKTSTVAARFCALREINRPLFMTGLQSPGVDKLVEVAIRYGKDLADLIYANDSNYQQLLDLLDHDDCPFVHATNVCIYTVILAKHLTIEGPAEPPAIAAGALLHDLGKRKIAPAILRKPGDLTDEELYLVRRHPQTGFDELSRRTDLTWSQMMMVYQHHERVDGRGYPVQIPRGQIDYWARICAVANAFDAMTSERRYRRTKSPSDATHYLVDKSDMLFDKDVVKCWIKSVKPLH
jgi:HD-GYP domain-containing protein (c-di-GMP phosphodiesterase class II)